MKIFKEILIFIFCFLGIIVSWFPYFIISENISSNYEFEGLILVSFIGGIIGCLVGDKLNRILFK